MKKYWFTGYLEPFPAEAFTVKTDELEEPKYGCPQFSGIPCTLALSMRNCFTCVVVRHDEKGKVI